jgi:hypothetical protein
MKKSFLKNIIKESITDYLSELNTIKSSLDNIIKDTNDINKTLKEKKII